MIRIFKHSDNIEIKKIKADLEVLEQRMDTIVTNMNSLRGLINRKVRKTSDPFDSTNEFDREAEEFLSGVPYLKGLLGQDLNKQTE